MRKDGILGVCRRAELPGRKEYKGEEGLKDRLGLNSRLGLNRYLLSHNLPFRPSVKRIKDRSNVGGFGGSENESGSIVLDFLEFRKMTRRTARQKRVSVI